MLFKYSHLCRKREGAVVHGEGVEGVLFKSCNSLEGLKGLGFVDLIT